MILNNAGYLLAGLFRPPTQSRVRISGIVDITGNASFLYTIINNVSVPAEYFFATGGVQTAQVGSNGLNPERDDFNIKTAFGTAPESNRNTSLESGYTAGISKITMATLITPTGGLGIIQEVCKFINGNEANQIPKTICLMRDKVAPFAFTAGQAINIDHEVII